MSGWIRFLIEIFDGKKWGVDQTGIYDCQFHDYDEAKLQYDKIREKDHTLPMRLIEIHKLALVNPHYHDFG